MYNKKILIDWLIDWLMTEHPHGFETVTSIVYNEPEGLIDPWSTDYSVGKGGTQMDENERGDRRTSPRRYGARQTHKGYNYIILQNF